MRNDILLIVALVAITGFAAWVLGPSSAFTKQAEEVDGKTYITDRTGEKWEITQAVGLGFKARNFQYGIGRWAFQTLDESHISPDAKGAPGRIRVIGIDGETEDQAYSVRKLSRHEIANTKIDGKPIAVGY
jgi:hypothetical protein